VIGLDTNVLVRYFVKDDPVQTLAAVSLIHSLSPSEPGWVGLTALAELAWVLTRTYRLKRAGLIAILDKLLASRDIVIQMDSEVRKAFLLYRSHNVELGDCLIAVSAMTAGCSRTFTFDRTAARHAGMHLLA
jgi:predicted nucleic-acid-binding protein